jgi:aspartate/glutamate racemase
MLVSQEDSEVPIIDTSIAHALVAVDLSLVDEDVRISIDI